MRFAFIAKHRAIRLVEWALQNAGCVTLGHSCLEESYACQEDSGESSDRTRYAQELHGQRPHLWDTTCLACHAGCERFKCGLHRTERLMRANALKVRLRRFICRLTWGIVVQGPLTLMCWIGSSMPAFQTRSASLTLLTSGPLYVSSVTDLFSRRVVFSSMSRSMTAQFVTDALVMAIWRRGKPDALLLHSA